MHLEKQTRVYIIQIFGFLVGDLIGPKMAEREVAVHLVVEGVLLYAVGEDKRLRLIAIEYRVAANDTLACAALSMALVFKPPVARLIKC